MCVVSMIIDWKTQQWQQPPYQQQYTFYPYAVPTKEEIDEFRELLERARKYDQEHSQPDCGIEDKKKTLKQLADQMGIDISFVDNESA